MATDRDRASFEHWHIQRQRSRGYGAFLSDAEFVTRDESGRYRTLGLDDALEAWCAALASAPAAPPVEQQARELTYSSTQATECAGCGVRKHTPLRIDAMGGYVCLTCISNKLGSMLGEFGHPEPAQPAPQAGAAEPTAWLNYRCKVENGELVGHHEPEVSFRRASYGYDWAKSVPLYRAAHPTEQPSQDAAWQKIGDEVALILSDPDSELSRGAKRALDWIAARAAQAQGESTGGTPHG